MPIFKFSFLSIFQSFSYELLYTTSQHMVLFYTLYERSEARPLLVCYFGKVEPIYNASNLCTSTTSSSRLICIEPFWSATQAFQRDWLKHSKQSFSQSYWEKLFLVQWTQNHGKWPQNVCVNIKNVVLTSSIIIDSIDWSYTTVCEFKDFPATQFSQYLHTT